MILRNLFNSYVNIVCNFFANTNGKINCRKSDVWKLFSRGGYAKPRHVFLMQFCQFWFKIIFKNCRSMQIFFGIFAGFSYFFRDDNSFILGISNNCVFLSWVSHSKKQRNSRRSSKVVVWNQNIKTGNFDELIKMSPWTN